MVLCVWFQLIQWIDHKTQSDKNSYAIQFLNAWMFVVNNLYTNWQSISGFLPSSYVSIGVSNVICDIIFYFNIVYVVEEKWKTPKNNLCPKLIK